MLGNTSVQDVYIAGYNCFRVDGAAFYVGSPTSANKNTSLGLRTNDAPAIDIDSSQNSTFHGNISLFTTSTTDKSPVISMYTGGEETASINFYNSERASNELRGAITFEMESPSTGAEYGAMKFSAGGNTNTLTLNSGGTSTATFAGDVTIQDTSGAGNLTLNGDPATLLVDGVGSAYSVIAKGAGGNWGALSFCVGTNDNSSSTWWIGLDDDSGDDLHFANYQFGTSYLILDKSAGATFAGNVGIGNTPAQKFQVFDGSTNRFYVGSNGDIVMPAMYGNNIGGDTFRDFKIRSDGLLGVDTSSERYKKNIEDMGDIGWIYNLRPVDFEWKKTDKKDWGLIAEEVLKVKPELTTNDENGDVETVLYSKLVPILLKAVQELSAKVEALENK